MVSIGFKSDRGNLRSGNEDSIFVMPDKNIYIVADGVGGHSAGELASRMAVGYMAQYVAINSVDAVQSEEELKDFFLSCYSGANSLIYNKSSEELDKKGMATTAVAAYIKGDMAYVINVGDSRCYLVRDGACYQVTEDHSYVNAMVKSGLLTREEAEKHPDRNMITRALGAEEDVEPDFFSFPVYPKDVLILCTDGLYGEVSEEKMVQFADYSKTMHSMAKNLVDEANRHGGKDNISVICVKVL